MARLTYGIISDYSEKLKAKRELLSELRDQIDEIEAQIKNLAGKPVSQFAPRNNGKFAKEITRGQFRPILPSRIRALEARGNKVFNG